MTRNNKILFGIVILLSLGLLVLLFVFNDDGTTDPGKKETKKEKKKKIVKKKNDWTKKFSNQVLDPYGTYIFYQLIKAENKNIKVIRKNHQYEYLDTVRAGSSMYVYVGEEFTSHDSKVDKILQFVKNGNSAFIASENYPLKIRVLVNNSHYVSTTRDTSIRVNFTHPDLADTAGYKFNYIFKRKPIPHYWSVFEQFGEGEEQYTADYTTKFNYDTYKYDTIWNEDLPRTMVAYETMGEGKDIFISIKLGKGTLYLYTVPYAFTNLVMQREKGFSHAEKVISCLPETSLIFDEAINRQAGSGSGSGFKRPPPKMKRESLLQFIFSRRSLRWAYYTSMIALILFLLFRGKRKQNVIPPYEKNENNSVAFADTLSKLYLQNGQHKYIVWQQEKNFINFIRNRYHIISPKADDDYIGSVSRKSGIPAEKIKALFKRFEKARGGSFADEKDVIEIHQQIEYFYKNCK